MILNLPNEIFFKILDNLNICELFKLSNVNRLLNDKMKYYKIKLYFINNSSKVNNILQYDFFNIKNTKKEVIERLEYICQNDFIFYDFHEKVFLNYISGIDINGFSVFEYYISQLKGNYFYILPEIEIKFNKNNIKQFYLKQWDSQIKYDIYYEDEINLINVIKRYICPKENYKNVLYNNPGINEISSYLI